MQRIEKFPRRSGTGDPMTQPFPQPRVLPQWIEVLQTVPASRVQHQKAFYGGGLVQASFALLHAPGDAAHSRLRPENGRPAQKAAPRPALSNIRREVRDQSRTKTRPLPKNFFAAPS